MTTVSTLVYDAMYAARVLGQDETPTSADVQLVLRRLNRMLDSWSNEKQMIFLNDSETFTLTAGQQAYSTSLLAEGRPININSMRLNLNGIDYPVSQIDQQKWNAIPIKSVSSIPVWFYYDGAMPNAQMFFYPVPFAAFTAYIYCQRPLAGALTLTDTLTMPQGYEAAIVAGLAADIWPSFKAGDVPKALIAERTQTRAVLKRTNFNPMEMVNPIDRPPSAFSDAYLVPPW